MKLIRNIAVALEEWRILCKRRLSPRNSKIGLCYNFIQQTTSQVSNNVNPVLYKICDRSCNDCVNSCYVWSPPFV